MKILLAVFVLLNQSYVQANNYSSETISTTASTGTAQTFTSKTVSSASNTTPKPSSTLSTNNYSSETISTTASTGTAQTFTSKTVSSASNTTPKPSSTLSTVTVKLTVNNSSTISNTIINSTSSLAAGVSKIDTVSTTSSIPQEPSSTVNVTLIVSIILGISLVLVLSIVAFLFRRHIIFNIFKRKEPSNDVSTVDDPSEFYVLCPRDIPLYEFNDYVHLIQSDAGLLNERQFELMARLTAEIELKENFTVKAARAQENLQKNRFTNILPFDHSRVRLLVEDDSGDNEISSSNLGTDYINANYIMGHHGKREFIACQGPLESTIDDMWRLIWEQNVRCIVMLTLLCEKQRQKCVRYWPLEVDGIECHGQGDLSVKLVSESTLGSYAVRVLEVCMARERRKITHLHYLKWEDFKAPDLTEFWEFLRDFRRHVPRAIDAPILVHCSAGVGRTGTFIALDWILHSLQNGATTINVPNHILQMRTRRRYMVQNFRQLDFIFTFLNWYLKHEMSINVESNTDV